MAPAGTPGSGPPLPRHRRYTAGPGGASLIELLVVMAIAAILLALATNLFRRDTMAMNLPVAAGRLEQFLDQAGSLARARGQAVSVLLAEQPGDQDVDGRHLRLAVAPEPPVHPAPQSPAETTDPPAVWQWTGHGIDLPQATRLVVDDGLPTRQIDRPRLGDVEPVWRQVALITPEGREQGATRFEVRRTTADANEPSEAAVIRLRLNAMGRLTPLTDASYPAG